MIRNYFKTAWRNLVKQKFYSIIKIGGLAIGIAACLLIALFILNELSYDKNYQHADRIFRVIGINAEEGHTTKGVSFPAPFAKAIKDELPEIEKVARINPHTLFTGGGNLVRRPDAAENEYEEGFSFADPALIDLLQIKMVYGNPTGALQQPGSVVISRKMADKYYPGQNPVGKTLIISDNKNQPAMISGVMENFPVNSHLRFDFLISLKDRSFWKGEQATWGASNYITYVQLKPGTDVKGLGDKMMTALFDKYLVPAFKQDGLDEKSIQQLKKNIWLELQPVGDIYLSADIRDDSLSHGDIRLVWLFGAVALFILVLAMINFINLSTAKSANRAKEVGIRKTVGSLRKDLVGQFLSESVLFSIISFILGIMLALLFLPEFNRLAGKSLSMPWSNLWFITATLVMALATGVIAGIYPALYLSSFRPVQVLKGSLATRTKKSLVRSSLVVFQFAISIVLIIATIVVTRQMNLILTQKIGFEKDQVLLLQGTGSLANQMASFKSRLKQIPEVKQVSASEFLPISGLGSKRNGNEMWENGTDKNELKSSVQMWQVDNEYIPAMGMKMKQGRNFSADIRGDSATVVINETLAAKLNLKEPVGKQITNGYQTFTVIGVVQDFNFESLKENIGGVCLTLGNSPSIIAVKVTGSNMAATIKAVTGVWKEFAPSQPVRYSFLDEGFARMYDDVLRVKNIFTGFAIFAIIIACLGLFALSAFIAEQRRKEIGIRKVLGATVGNVSVLLSKDFIKLVLIAMVVASPVAYYFMHKWLEDFAYRTPIGWEVFALAGSGALLIALLTVSYQAIKAAIANPVKSLRTE